MRKCTKLNTNLKQTKCPRWSPLITSSFVSYSQKSIVLYNQRYNNNFMKTIVHCTR